MLTQEQLQVLAEAMTQKDAGGARRVDAGYTYFGQFISHEIVAATPRPGDPTPPRVVSPLLALDSLYGRPHEMDVWLPGGRFPAPNSGLAEDLVRDANGAAQIPEPRNDDNVIIAQLHRFLQRFHNFLLEKQFTKDPLQAREWVTKVVQLVVVEDFLHQLLEPEVFKSYFRSNERWLTFDKCGIPPHFSHAAYRFGHSMIRVSYEGFDKSIDSGNRKLTALLRQHKLEAATVVDWNRFFGEPILKNGVQDAMAIDPFVVNPMLSIADAPAPINIIKANLAAGQRMNLPTGKAYVMELLAGPNGTELQSRFGLAPLTGLGMLSQHIPAASGITIDNLPLWPYVLLEASTPTGADGRHLGVLGSLICAEVIAQSIRQARVTIHGTRWPSSADEVLATLGPLGPHLKKQRSPQGTEPVLRDFCMHHVIQLVLGLDSN